MKRKLTVKMGKETGLREENFLFIYLLGFYVLSGFSEKKKKLIFFLNNADMENCGASKSFGFIYIYRLKNCPILKIYLL